MKKILALALVLSVVGAACSPKKTEGTKLAAGTPAYKLAKDLSARLPVLDPDQNAELLTSRKFIVSAGDVVELLRSTLGDGALRFAEEDLENFKAAVGRAALQIGERRLLLTEAEAAKIAASPEEFEEALAAQYARAGGEDQFLEKLNKNNVDVALFKKSLGEDMTIRRFLEATVFKAIEVGEDEVQKAYGEDKTATVRHILLLTQGKPESEIPAIRKKMEDILARAKKGEDFAALAVEFTEDPGSKENGGLYENFPRGMMVKPFEDAAFSVPVGEISDIVETRYGFHILKVENRAKETELLETVRTEIEARLKQGKQAGAYQQYLDGLKNAAGFVEIKF